MGNIANILVFAGPRRPKVASAAIPVAGQFGLSDVARLIPGMRFPPSPGKTMQSVRWDETWPTTRPASPSAPGKLAAGVLPEFLKGFPPAMLGVATRDMALVSLVAILEKLLLRSGRYSLTLNSTTLCFYLTAFMLFAAQENLYCNRQTSETEYGAIIRVIAWTTLLASFALECSPARPTVLPVFLLSWASLCALVIARRCWRAIFHATADCRNVLVIGSGILAQTAATAIQNDSRSGHSIKGFVAEPHFRGASGQSILGRIAREQFIDEVITQPMIPRWPAQPFARRRAISWMCGWFLVCSAQSRHRSPSKVSEACSC